MLTEVILKRIPVCSAGAMLAFGGLVFDSAVRAVSIGYILFFANLFLITLLYHRIFRFNVGGLGGGNKANFLIPTFLKFFIIFVGIGVSVSVLEMEIIPLFTGCFISLIIYLIENIVNYSAFLKTRGSS